MARTPLHNNSTPAAVTWRTAMYCRVSTEEQAESGLGLGDQRARCEGMAMAKGWATPRLFSDDGISGTLGPHKRPALQKLLDAAQAHELDVVIIPSLDRLGRNTRLVLDLTAKLSALGVSLVSCKEAFDTTTPQGQFVLTLFAALGQLERDMISQRTAGGLAILSEREGETGGRIPYGYRRVGQRDATGKRTSYEVAVDPAAAAIVRRIFGLRRRGESTHAIAARLNADHVPTPRGVGEWRHSSVAVILRNKDIYYGGRRGRSAQRWPAIVGRAVVAAASPADVVAVS